jgi:hypothetical protein
MNRFIVIHPHGNRNVIDVADITGTEYEKSDYCLASERNFSEKKEARKYAKQLAGQYGRYFAGPLDEQEEGYD